MVEVIIGDRGEVDAIYLQKAEKAENGALMLFVNGGGKEIPQDGIQSANTNQKHRYSQHLIRLADKTEQNCNQGYKQ